MKYLVRIILLTCFLFCHNSVTAQTATQTPHPKSTSTKPKVELAVWNENAEKSFGITEGNFKSMGLRKLTLEEYVAVLNWGWTRETQAESRGRDEGRQAVEATSSTYSCGPDKNKTDDQSLSKVNLFIVPNTDTPSEIMSRVRERLRRMSDVQIVFDKKEADLVVEVSGFEAKMRGSNTAVGYTAATIVTVPCTWKIGTQTGIFPMFQDSLLNTSNLNAGDLVESIVTTIDSHDIESVRQQNAMWKKTRLIPNK